MLNVKIMSAIIIGMWLFSHACFNPADNWAAGIVWTNGEQVDFTIIDEIGNKGTDFFKVTEGDIVKYTYRSHYDPQNVMIYLGYFTISYQQSAKAPRMAVIFDTTQDASSFNYAKAVRAELDWLANTRFGIVKMSVPDRELVESSLSAVGHGNAQYWTGQQEVLSYNMWFEYDSVNGVWGTNGVRGVFGGCGLDVAFSLPPEELLPVSIEKVQDISYIGETSVTVTPNPFNPTTNITLTSSHNNHSNSFFVKIYNLNGQLISDLSSVFRTSSSANWNATGLPRGIYVLKAKIGNKMFSKKLFLDR